MKTYVMSFIDKLRGAREKLERKTFEKKAQKRAKARRIEKGDPEGFGEKAAVAGKETKKLGKQAKEFASESVPESAKKGAGSAGSFGEGAEDVIADVEGGDLDMFGPDDEGDGMDDGLDMDLDDIP